MNSQSMVSSGSRAGLVPARGRMAIWISFLALILVCRIALMVFAPHQDPSEARYAEISRKMVETGDWIMPQHLYGVPFWAKPPLSMWLSATGMEVFGVNEFGSRVFIFGAGMLVVFLVWRFARREESRESALIAAAVLVSMPMFFYCSAAVMTDMALVLGTTLSMVGFWNCVRRSDPSGGYLFFGGAAIGMLAKGPVALVLSLAPIAVWTLLKANWKDCVRRLPWFSGGIPAILASAAWYVAAEKRTPGFLDYFFVGEHWRRFTVRGWDGDLYGNAHAEIPGTIWLFGILAVFPWVLVAIAGLAGWKSKSSGWPPEERGRALYLILWSLWPLVFFTPSRNIISTYVLPALPAAALLAASVIQSIRGASPVKARRLETGLIITSSLLVFGATVITLGFPALAPKHSEKELISEYRTRAVNGEELFYFNKRRYSAEFYAGGHLKTIETADELERVLTKPGLQFVASRPKDLDLLPDVLRKRLKLILGRGERHSLYQEVPYVHGA